MDRGSKNYRRKHCSNLNCICNCFQSIYTRTWLLGPCREWIYLDQSFLILFDYLSNSFYLLSNSLGHSSLIHSLQIYCPELTRPISLYILGLGFKTCPYNYHPTIFEIFCMILGFFFFFIYYYFSREPWDPFVNCWGVIEGLKPKSWASHDPSQHGQASN